MRIKDTMWRKQWAKQRLIHYTSVMSTNSRSFSSMLNRSILQSNSFEEIQTSFVDTFFNALSTRPKLDDLYTFQTVTMNESITTSTAGLALCRMASHGKPYESIQAEAIVYSLLQNIDVTEFRGKKRFMLSTLTSISSLLHQCSSTPVKSLARAKLRAAESIIIETVLSNAMSPSDCAQAAFAYALAGEAAPRVYTAIEQEILNRINEFTPHSITKTLLSLAHGGWNCDQIFDVIFHHYNTHATEFTLSQLAGIAYSMAITRQWKRQSQFIELLHRMNSLFQQTMTNRSSMKQEKQLSFDIARHIYTSIRAYQLLAYNDFEQDEPYPMGKHRREENQSQIGKQRLEEKQCLDEALIQCRELVKVSKNLTRQITLLQHSINAKRFRTATLEGHTRTTARYAADFDFILSHTTSQSYVRNAYDRDATCMLEFSFPPHCAAIQLMDEHHYLYSATTPTDALLQHDTRNILLASRPNHQNELYTQYRRTRRRLASKPIHSILVTSRETLHSTSPSIQFLDSLDTNTLNSNILDAQTIDRTKQWCMSLWNHTRKQPVSTPSNSSPTNTAPATAKNTLEMTNSTLFPVKSPHTFVDYNSTYNILHQIQCPVTKTWLQQVYQSMIRDSALSFESMPTDQQISDSLYRKDVSINHATFNPSLTDFHTHIHHVNTEQESSHKGPTFSNGRSTFSNKKSTSPNTRPTWDELNFEKAYNHPVLLYKDRPHKLLPSVQLRLDLLEATTDWRIYTLPYYEWLYHIHDMPSRIHLVRDTILPIIEQIKFDR